MIFARVQAIGRFTRVYFVDIIARQEKKKQFQIKFGAQIWSEPVKMVQNEVRSAISHTRTHQHKHKYKHHIKKIEFHEKKNPYFFPSSSFNSKTLDFLVHKKRVRNRKSERKRIVLAGIVCYIIACSMYMLWSRHDGDALSHLLNWLCVVAVAAAAVVVVASQTA